MNIVPSLGIAADLEAIRRGDFVLLESDHESVTLMEDATGEVGVGEYYAVAPTDNPTEAETFSHNGRTYHNEMNGRMLAPLTLSGVAQAHHEWKGA